MNRHLFKTSIFLIILLGGGQCSGQAQDYKLSNTSLNEFKKNFKFSLPDYRNSNCDFNNLTKYLIKLNSNESKIAYYGIAHEMYLPLIIAFKEKRMDVISQYDTLFSESKLSHLIPSLGNDRLNELTYFYLVSNYLKYKSHLGNKEEKLRLNKLYKIIKGYILDFWIEDVGNNWEAEPFRYKGKRSRVAYLLDHELKDFKKEERFHGAIVDQDLYLMAIGTNLAAYELIDKKEVSDELTEIVYYFLEVFKRKVKFLDEKRWVFQPGAFSEHRDYKYAGNKQITANIEVNKVSGISWDTSHFSRFPAFLVTLKSILREDSPQRRYVDRLIEGLSNQFIEKVVVYPNNKNDLIQFNNFMDGNNGVFRYRFKGKFSGYTPYTNCLHIYWGWWKLLNDERIYKIYEEISKNYPEYTSEQLKKFSPSPSMLNVYKDLVDL